MTARHSLDAVFRPQSVAVVGASARPGRVGHTLLRNLLAGPFEGAVYPVNPARRAVLGVRCAPDLAALPEVPDLALVATPAADVAGVLRACIDRGVKGAVVVSAGFTPLDDEVRALARGRLRLVGPNSQGVAYPPAGLNAFLAGGPVRPGGVALLSQSGSVCASVIDWAAEAGFGFSAVVNTGSAAGVDFADLLDYFADDPPTRGIVLYLESVGDARRFLSAARAVARTKPVIAVKAGRADPSDGAYEAALRRAGVLRVRNVRDLFYMSEVLSTQPPPRGPALAVVTNAAAPGLMAVDALRDGGGDSPRLSAAAQARIDAVAPPRDRPETIDLRGAATPEAYREAVAACQADPGVQGVLVMLTPQALARPTETARELASLPRSNKPLLASWLGGAAVRAGKDVLRAAGVPCFFSPESAVAAFLSMVRYREAQELLYETPEALPEDFTPDAGLAGRVIADARAAGRADSVAAAVLTAYGLGPGSPPAGAAELRLGCEPDEKFGPVIRLAAAGELGRYLADGTVGLPPLNRSLARRLLERTRVGSVVRSRGGPAAGQLETLVVRFSQLVTDQADVAAAELTVWVTDREAVPGPGRVTLTEPGRPRRLAIRPYPNQYTATHRLADGGTVLVRAVRPEDEPLVVAMFGRLSERTVRMRFFGLIRQLTHERLIRLCHLDYDREMALAALAGGEMVGESRYFLDPDDGSAEFAVTVRDDWQGRGLGRHLLGRLTAVARERGVRRLVGVVLRENAAMLRTARALGFVVRDGADGETAEAVFDLNPEP